MDMRLADHKQIIPAPEMIPRLRITHPHILALAASLGAPLPTLLCPLAMAVQLVPQP